MNLHPSTFEYLKPTAEQMTAMSACRSAFADVLWVIQSHVPLGADHDHVVRLIRDAAMWTNVAITREADGTPRTDDA